MKKMMSRFRSMLKKNILLLILLISFAIVIFLTLWKYSLEEVLSKAETDYGAAWKDLFVAETELSEDRATIKN